MGAAQQQWVLEAGGLGGSIHGGGEADWEQKGCKDCALSVCVCGRGVTGAGRGARECAGRQGPNSRAAGVKEALGLPPAHKFIGFGSWKAFANALKAELQEGSTRDQRRIPDYWEGERDGTHTHTSDPRHAGRTASCCGGHSPSARERISDTVLLMVGITTAPAGGSQAGTLHLSRRRAGGRAGCAAPRAQPPPGRASHLGQRRHQEPPGHSREEEGDEELRPQSRLGPPRSGRGAGSRGGAGAGAGGGVYGARAHSLVSWSGTGIAPGLRVPPSSGCTIRGEGTSI